MVLPKDLLLGSLLKLNYEFVNCRGDYKFAENISQKSSLSLNMFEHPIHCIREIMFKRSDIEPNSSENVRCQTVIMNVITTPPATSEYHWYSCTWRLANMSQSFFCAQYRMFQPHQRGATDIHNWRIKVIGPTGMISPVVLQVKQWPVRN